MLTKRRCYNRQNDIRITSDVSFYLCLHFFPFIIVYQYASFPFFLNFCKPSYVQSHGFDMDGEFGRRWEFSARINHCAWQPGLSLQFLGCASTRSVPVYAMYFEVKRNTRTVLDRPMNVGFRSRRGMYNSTSALFALTAATLIHAFLTWTSQLCDTRGACMRIYRDCREQQMKCVQPHKRSTPAKRKC